MRYGKKGFLVVLALAGLLPIVAAAATAAEAAKLGHELTPVGAEAAGNAAGTIPAWEGAKRFRPEQLKVTYRQLEDLRDRQPAAPAGLLAQDRLVHKPPFVVTPANMAESEKRRVGKGVDST